MSAGGDVAHGHEGGVWEGGGFVLPGFADVEQEGGVGLPALLDESFGRDFDVRHGSRIYPYRESTGQAAWTVLGPELRVGMVEDF